MTPEGARYDRFLKRAISELKGEPMAGGKFFALVDELEASERRLDEAAEPLLKAMQDTEAAAKHAIEGRMAKLQAAQDYIKRMHAAAEKLNEGNGNNGGPIVTSQS